jgi:hypothetical protein
LLLGGSNKPIELTAEHLIFDNTFRSQFYQVNSVQLPNCKSLVMINSNIDSEIDYKSLVKIQKLTIEVSSLKNLQANIAEIPTEKLWLRLNFNSLHLSELNSTLLHIDFLQVIKALRIDVNRFIIPHFLIQNTSLDNTPLSEKFKISFQIFKEYAQYTFWEKGKEEKTITVLIYGTLEFEMLREEYFDW